jgi:hypothetical protein
MVGQIKQENSKRKTISPLNTLSALRRTRIQKSENRKSENSKRTTISPLNTLSVQKRT